MAPTPSSSKIEVADASGTDDAMAMPTGKFNPEIKAGLTVAPEVVYSPIVPLFSFVTNRSAPENAMSPGKSVKVRHRRGPSENPGSDRDNFI